MLEKATPTTRRGSTTVCVFDVCIERETVIMITVDLFGRASPTHKHHKGESLKCACCCDAAVELCLPWMGLLFKFRGSVGLHRPARRPRTRYSENET